MLRPSWSSGWGTLFRAGNPSSRKWQGNIEASLEGGKVRVVQCGELFMIIDH